jgi:ferredoxin
MLKPKAKKRKYCGTCRKAIQANFKNKVKQAKQDRAQNLPVEAIEEDELIKE